MDQRALDLDVADLAYLRDDLMRVLARQEADVHPHRAAIGHPVERVAAGDPAEVDRRAVEHLGRFAAERERLDRAEHVERLQHRVVAEPRRRGVGRAPVHDQPHHQHALGLDADVQVGRLTRDREVAAEPLRDRPVGAAVLELLGLLVGHDHQAAPATRSWLETSLSAHIIAARPPFMS